MQVSVHYFTFKLWGRAYGNDLYDSWSNCGLQCMQVLAGSEQTWDWFTNGFHCKYRFILSKGPCTTEGCWTFEACRFETSLGASLCASKGASIEDWYSEARFRFEYKESECCKKEVPVWLVWLIRRSEEDFNNKPNNKDKQVWDEFGSQSSNDPGRTSTEGGGVFAWSFQWYLNVEFNPMDGGFGMPPYQKFLIQKNGWGTITTKDMFTVAGMWNLIFEFVLGVR